jgi:hypothetical protein
VPAPSSPQHSRFGFAIHATDKLLIGGPGVTAATGFAINAGETLDIGDLEPGDVVYAIRGASADITAHLLIR